MSPPVLVCGPSSRRALAALLAAIVLVLLCAAPAPAHSGAAAHRARSAGVAASGPELITVGQETLHRCTPAPAGYCGHLAVALDPRVPDGPHIDIAFRWYPASEPGPGGASGTAVPVEGGPGYGSIGSVAEGYAPMYGPMLRHWNMLAIDNRGTGASEPIDCPSLQDFSGPTDSSAFQQAAAQCAAVLNSRWRYPGGEPVHASDLFTTAIAAQDMADIVRALNLAKIDLYGDSYGSYFAQVFASRFPKLVRSLVLDSTYSTVELDPWYRSTVDSMPAAFNAACSRYEPCAQASGNQDSWQRIGQVAALLRAGPISGLVPGPEGDRKQVSMNVVGLVDLINDAAADPQIYRDIDAADRALLQEHDPLPLLRLYAQRLAFDELYFDVPARDYSAGLYLSVSCLDYAQLFSMHSTPAVRAQELAASEAALAPETFSPFTTTEWLSQDQNTEAYTACLDWPSPTVAEPPVEGPPPLLPASMPVLVLGGELDTWTPPSDHPKILAEIGGDSRFIEVANATHIVGDGDTACGATIVQEFVERPRRVGTLDDTCAGAQPPLHAVGIYPDSLKGETPATALAGNGASQSALRLADAAVQTAGDAIARYEATEDKLDHGLYGGTAALTQPHLVIVLSGDELIAGVPVSGRLKLTGAADAVDGMHVSAELTAHADGAPEEMLSASWDTEGAAGPAEISGTAGSQPLSAAMPAP